LVSAALFRAGSPVAAEAIGSGGPGELRRPSCAGIMIY